MLDVLFPIVYGVSFAVIAGGAFALMTQNLRSAASTPPRASATRKLPPTVRKFSTSTSAASGWSSCTSRPAEAAAQVGKTVMFAISR